MADHVDELEEIRRLQAGQFESGIVIPLNEHCSRAYLSTLAVVRRAWEAFHMEFRQPGQRDAWSEVPNSGQVMAFLQWCLLRRQGKISGKLTTTTLKKYLVQLNKLFCDKLDRGISPSHFLKLTKFIGEGLVRKGASQEAVARPVATPAVVTDILYFLWALDEHEFDHPRIRLQISFSIMILLYFGIRPGEFIESSAHAGNNEGLLYKDLDIMIMSSDGRRRIGIEVVLRNRKGARGKRVKDISMLLLEDHEKPELCPVAQFLAMALADDALQDVKCAADMRSIAAPPPGVFKRLRITDDMKQTPILRRLTGRGQGLSPDKIFTCKELGPMMEALGYRAAHRERFMPYAIRRGHGALLDRSVSGAVRQKRMGHQHESQFQHYINRFSAVDGQSMVLDRPMEQEIVDRLASMATTVDVNAPKPHRACLTDVGRQDKRAGLRAHRAMRQEYFDSSEAFASATVTKTPEDDKSAQMVKEIARGRPPPSKMFQMYLRWDSPRSEIIQMFYNREPDQKAQLEDILEPLASIACPDRTTWRYPRTTVTTDGLCHCGTRQKRYDIRSLKQGTNY
ncbi:hypothetical protein CKM354_000931700 [Cercospora kikuchii]|uniref:Uncharacterized protein n=1 Tax=Cercospora kikuchii TaxID=84275 RepID=A0A9P3CKK5_9PEZI|nr:uncharacterized protein CKM354_000931700 [Cercospora kikuchii]GIZ46179.1 hypothetical protein CKM354_000931700 [Cercospora kikuchii]